MLTVLTFPHLSLRSVSSTIDKVDKTIKALASNMLLTMYNYKGIGLAANQVGILKRILVLDVSQKDGDQPDGLSEASLDTDIDEPPLKASNPMVIINPIILESSKNQSSYEEGCLSVPGMLGFIERPDSITLQYTDLNSQEHIIQASGLLSTCLQHEIDHLNGIMFFDHLSKLKKETMIRKFKRLSATNNNSS